MALLYEECLAPAWYKGATKPYFISYDLAPLYRAILSESHAVVDLDVAAVRPGPPERLPAVVVVGPLTKFCGGQRLYGSWHPGATLCVAA